MSYPGEDGDGHRTLLGFRLPLSGFRKAQGLFHRVKVAGAGLTDRTGRAPRFLAAAAPSHLWPGADAAFADSTLTVFRPIPVRRNLLLGIAKLLPSIVPVKRETPYVVSLAMTA